MSKLMGFAVALGLPLALLSIDATTRTAEAAVVYCRYIGYPKGCVARPGVRLYPRPAARAVAAPKPTNWNGGVNRVGRRR
ncbi:hypothetical protein C7450_111186 [Chelatococcus asaccharovorans]|uniref:Uncharacterized protein n=1 Tax=Chelatococcus asaccharovorans TaxID=28210 RepID=A0A2V3TYW6_9HYPH|nr:hypothetical protein [Chelatococcus asaccharovorans]PXW54654.1 hypothetical protein C7450_111186 [Chelatococcus asaccharovorans]